MGSSLKVSLYRFHTASPATFGVGDPIEDQKNVIDPAVNGKQGGPPPPLMECPNQRIIACLL